MSKVHLVYDASFRRYKVIRNKHHFVFFFLQALNKKTTKRYVFVIALYV